MKSVANSAMEPRKVNQRFQASAAGASPQKSELSTCPTSVPVPRLHIPERHRQRGVVLQRNRVCGTIDTHSSRDRCFPFAFVSSVQPQFNDAQLTTHSNLLLTILHKADVRAEKIGDSSGTIGEL
jgi:hypothetical protein